MNSRSQGLLERLNEQRNIDNEDCIKKSLQISGAFGLELASLLGSEQFQFRKFS